MIRLFKKVFWYNQLIVKVSRARLCFSEIKQTFKKIIPIENKEPLGERLFITLPWPMVRSLNPLPLEISPLKLPPLRPYTESLPASYHEQCLKLQIYLVKPRINLLRVVVCPNIEISHLLPRGLTLLLIMTTSFIILRPSWSTWSPSISWFSLVWFKNNKNYRGILPLSGILILNLLSARRK